MIPAALKTAGIVILPPQIHLGSDHDPGWPPGPPPPPLQPCLRIKALKALNTKRAVNEAARILSALVCVRVRAGVRACVRVCVRVRACVRFN